MCVMDRLRQRGAWLGLIALACGGRAHTDDVARTGGAGNAGGAQTGGSQTAPNGGVPSGGKATGGTSTGGTSAGTPGGSKSSGGHTNTGGTFSSAASGGRTATGGSALGGSVTGGAGSGSVITGGTGSVITGGTSSVITGGTGSVITGGTGSVITGGTGGAHTGGTLGSGGASLECQVGVRINDCCSKPIAVEPKAFEDPCVLPYRSYFTNEDLAACPGAEKCLMVNCTHPAPPSRVARLRSGECVFDNECLAAAAPHNFCSVATDYNRCCSCPEVFPRVLVEADPCVLTEGVPEPGSCADCSAVKCAPCNAPKPSMYCDYDSVTALSVCRGRIE